jgi:hypothetical protein
VFESGKITAGGSKLHWRAFYERTVDDGVSISRIAGLDAAMIWTLGDAAGVPRNKTAVGRGDFVAATVWEARAIAQTLDVVPDPPPLSHALIIGWPAEDETRKTICMLLARKASPSPRT